MNSLEGESALTASSRAALAEYLEELARRIERGENVTYEGEVAAHADFAGPLHELWPALQLLVSLGKTASTANAELNPPSDIGPSLGEFRILSELGRGGMGVVYEAEQGPLGRRVALKVLPFAAVLDQRQLTRFQNEARAAASLHHTNIVPVFSVGCDRGRHYYAMQLIRGRSLEELLRERRERKLQPAPGGDRPPQAPIETVNGLLDDTQRPQERFTHIARLGIQAAEALHCAHENGVVHRDVKPSNLLIDTSGKLWVADFGLARLGGDVGVTLTGDMLGTLRYMSPEQAAGMPAAVDHRTDIFSLGATLYEMATERPVVQGQDRAAMLREIAETDPAPPRKYTPSMPADLETILLKCLAKEPSARYETAQALADDLRRFLENKPVVARRPSWTDRTGKWSRRHRALLTVSTAALLLTTIAASTAALISWRSYAAAQEALDQRTRALAEANENLDLAGASIERMLGRTGTEAWQRGDAAEGQQLLDDAVKLLDNMLQRSDDPKLIERAARANLQIHFAYMSLNAPDKAMQTTERGVQLARALHERQPANDRYTLLLSSALNDLGGMKVFQDQIDDAGAAYAEAIFLAEGLLAAHPGDAEVISRLQGYLDGRAGIEHASDRLDNAARLYRRIDDLYDAMPEAMRQSPTELSGRAASLHNEAMLARDQDRLADAMQYTEQAIALQELALTENASHPRRREYLANHHWLRAQLLGRQGRFDEALRQTRAYKKDFADQYDVDISSAALLLDIAAEEAPGAPELVHEAESLIRSAMAEGTIGPLMAGTVSELLTHTLPRELRNRSLASEIVRAVSDDSDAQFENSASADKAAN